VKIILKKKFEKQLIKLWIKVKDNFKEKLNLLINDKYNRELNYHKLKWELLNFHSINITWDIRAILKEENWDLIIFYLIWTHSELY